MILLTEGEFAVCASDLSYATGRIAAPAAKPAP
jgi:hypothetical protein